MADHDERLTKLHDTDLTLADGELDVRGKKVVDETGEEIGDVDALYVDRDEAKVRFLAVRYGAVLGLGGSETLIPVEAVRSVNGDQVQLGHGRQQIGGAPRYDPDLRQEPRWEDYYGYYGYLPYWGGAYTGYVPGTMGRMV